MSISVSLHFYSLIRSALHISTSVCNFLKKVLMKTHQHFCANFSYYTSFYMQFSLRCLFLQFPPILQKTLSVVSAPFYKHVRPHSALLLRRHPRQLTWGSMNREQIAGYLQSNPTFCSSSNLLNNLCIQSTPGPGAGDHRKSVVEGKGEQSASPTPLETIERELLILYQVLL